MAWIWDFLKSFDIPSFPVKIWRSVAYMYSATPTSPWPFYKGVSCRTVALRKNF